MPKMKYVGKGKWLRGVPARDLSAEEVKKHGGVKALKRIGLYEVVRKRIKVKQSPGLDNSNFLPASETDTGEVDNG